MTNPMKDLTERLAIIVKQTEDYTDGGIIGVPAWVIRQCAALLAHSMPENEPAEWQIRTMQGDGSWGDWFVTDKHTLAEVKEHGRVLWDPKNPIRGYVQAEVRALYALAHSIPERGEAAAWGIIYNDRCLVAYETKEQADAAVTRIYRTSTVEPLYRALLSTPAPVRGVGMGCPPSSQSSSSGKINGSTDDRYVAPPEYVIRHSGAFYRPNAQGYTYSLAEAWRLPKEEAEKYVNNDPHHTVTIQAVAEIADQIDQELEAAEAKVNTLRNFRAMVSPLAETLSENTARSEADVTPNPLQEKETGE